MPPCTQKETDAANVESAKLKDVVRMMQQQGKESTDSRLTVVAQAKRHCEGLGRFLQTEAGNARRKTTLIGALDYTHAEYLKEALTNGDAAGALDYLLELTGVTTGGDDNTSLEPGVRLSRPKRRCCRTDREPLPSPLGPITEYA